MASVKDQRSNVYNNASSYPSKSHMVGYHQMIPRTGGFGLNGTQNINHQMGDNVTTLANGLGGMNLQYGTNRSQAATIGTMSSEYGGAPASGNSNLWNQQQPAHMIYPSNVMPGTAQTNPMVQPSTVYTPMAPYMQQGYGYNQQQSFDNSPVTNTFNNRLVSSEVPSLMTPRRDSISSTEQDLPATPFNYGLYGHGVTIIDRSPNGVFVGSGTPSPSQLNSQGYITSTSKTSVVPPHILTLLQQEPIIPRAIPAPNSPVKPLDRSLENKNGETNVYIRGLLPETTDDMLYSWGKRFGDIASSKSIIDLKTNLCKGYVPLSSVKSLLDNVF
jgi:hypothetical protein